MAANPACPSYVPMLSPFIDGELSPLQRTEVERHVSVCRDCTGRVADLRAESGLVRLGMEMLADEADFKDFAQQVMARVTPERLPLLERWKLALSETLTHQRGALAYSLAGAACALAVAVPWVVSQRAPVGYASPQMAVESVNAESGARIAPVVKRAGEGNTIIWLVDAPGPAVAPDAGLGEESHSDELEMDGAPRTGEKALDGQRPTGGEL
ncbi:MAG TPA: zf-HC2 domain-containing protein [Myxococcaceae bacterium]|nr:zf-HC2 domain-containing protein [Myxococcaceae bacterium]